MSSHEKWEAIKCWALDLSQLYPDKLLSIPEIVAKIVEIDNLDHRDRVLLAVRARPHALARR